MNKKAFTLVELLITVAIIGIMSAISFVALANYKNRAKNLDSATTIMKDGILATQNLAFAPQDVNTKYYTAEIDFGAKNYSIRHYDVSDLDLGVIVNQNDIELPNGATIEPISPSPAGVLKVAFRVSDGHPGFGIETGAIDWGSTASADIKITDSTGEKHIIINNTTGEVHIQ